MRDIYAYLRQTGSKEKERFIVYVGKQRGNVVMKFKRIGRFGIHLMRKIIIRNLDSASEKKKQF